MRDHLDWHFAKQELALVRRVVPSLQIDLLVVQQAVVGQCYQRDLAIERLVAVIGLNYRKDLIVATIQAMDCLVSFQLHLCQILTC